MARRRDPVVPLPSYRDLLDREGYPAASSWGLWGDDDVLGCLNLIDDAARLRGLGAARSGTPYRLDLPLDLPSPPFLGRPAFEHEVSWHPGQVGQDDVLVRLNTQSSTQWDGFRHVRWPPGGFYNGLADVAHGVGHWADPGLVTRGVVVDVARFHAAQGRVLEHGRPDAIAAADLAAAVEATGVAVEPGDVLLVRTGWLAWYLGLSPDERCRASQRGEFSGLGPSREVAELLWDLRVAAVACDNPAVEVFPIGGDLSRAEQKALVQDPATAGSVFLHYALVALLGMPLGEFWDLEGLAEDCAADGVWDCLLVSAPLHLPGGVASPANAIAVR